MPHSRECSPTELICGYLDEHGIDYKVFEHELRFSAVSEARACGVAPHDMAKSLMLRDRDGYRLAVIPASQRLDLKKLRGLLGANGELRFATERELGSTSPNSRLVPYRRWARSSELRRSWISGFLSTGASSATPVITSTRCWWIHATSRISPRFRWARSVKTERFVSTGMCMESRDFRGFLPFAGRALGDAPPFRASAENKLDK